MELWNPMCRKIGETWGTRLLVQHVPLRANACLGMTVGERDCLLEEFGHVGGDGGGSGEAVDAGGG